MRKESESGFALVTALLAVFLLSVALALVATSLQIRMNMVRQEARSLTLTALSDAALAETLAHLAIDATYRGVAAHPFGGGTIGSEVVRVDTRRYVVRATASYAGVERAVRATVLRLPEGTQVVSWSRVER